MFESRHLRDGCRPDLVRACTVEGDAGYVHVFFRPNVKDSDFGAFAVKGIGFQIEVIGFLETLGCEYIENICIGGGTTSIASIIERREGPGDRTLEYRPRPPPLLVYPAVVPPSPVAPSSPAAPPEPAPTSPEYSPTSPELACIAADLAVQLEYAPSSPDYYAVSEPSGEPESL